MIKTTKILETNRLILQEFSALDAENLYQLNVNPEVIKYTGDPAFKSITEAEKFIANYSDYKKNGFGRWAVVLKSSDTFLGWCGLKLNSEGFIDIGFRFFEDQWGKGYATESANAVLNYGFNVLNLKEIIGRAASENKASVHVLEKLNMTFWKSDTCHGIENAGYYRINKQAYNNFL